MPWIVKADDCTQGGGEILADNHKGKKYWIVITWSYRDNGKFQRPWSAAMEEGSQSKTSRRADPYAASWSYWRDEGGLTRPESPIIYVWEWKYWTIVSCSRNDTTRIPVATNQIHWSKSNSSSVFDLLCFISSLTSSQGKFSLSTKFRFSKYY